MFGNIIANKIDPFYMHQCWICDWIPTYAVCDLALLFVLLLPVCVSQWKNINKHLYIPKNINDEKNYRESLFWQNDPKLQRTYIENDT